MRKIKSLSLLLAIAFALLASACNPSKTSEAPTEANTPVLMGAIDSATAKRLVGNYLVRAGHVKKGELLLHNTRCIWFSITQLDSLIQRIKREKGDGVRFYLAAYDKNIKNEMNSTLNKIDSAYWDYNTLVMVSTKYNGGKHFDYYNAKGPANNKGGALVAVPENQGELCPPPEKCDSEGATLLGDDE